MNPIRTAIFDISPDVRYVASYLDGELEYSQRPDLAGASSSESDKYEEPLRADRGTKCRSEKLER